VPQIVYCGPFDAVDVPACGIAELVPGKPVEVSKDAAAALLAQPENWQPAPSARSAAKEG
jgi:hypothetical protein